jgi:hypothetical protein
MCSGVDDQATPGDEPARSPLKFLFASEARQPLYGTPCDSGPATPPRPLTCATVLARVLSPGHCLHQGRHQGGGVADPAALERSGSSFRLREQRRTGRPGARKGSIDGRYGYED